MNESSVCASLRIKVQKGRLIVLIFVFFREVSLNARLDAAKDDDYGEDDDRDDEDDGEDDDSDDETPVPTASF
ncbi:hypothetical protein L596_021156 [Steinernema carpocapsae]|uniref:Uncharacterized protein n=1 Tax=Steinernema carpocapsae TaxID=34508 RepID=A0A4U5MVQ3_STECR|nr:hypothetical protein L596_021156 [Steinernema carpocapsae]